MLLEILAPLRFDPSFLPENYCQQRIVMCVCFYTSSSISLSLSFSQLQPTLIL